MTKISEQITHSGGCLCGEVRYQVEGPMRDVVLCHCSQCRKTHGHYAAYSATQYSNLIMTHFAGLKWYQASDKARRGFCGECGASLFWQRFGTDSICIAAGSLDKPTGLKSIKHIFVADAGDYYCIDDGLEKFAGSMEG